MQPGWVGVWALWLLCHSAPHCEGCEVCGSPTTSQAGRAVSSLTTARGPVSTLMRLTLVTSCEPGWGRRCRAPRTVLLPCPACPLRRSRPPLHSLHSLCLCVWPQRFHSPSSFPQPPFSDTCARRCVRLQREKTAPGIQGLSRWVRHGPGRSAWGASRGQLLIQSVSRRWCQGRLPGGGDSKTHALAGKQEV